VVFLLTGKNPYGGHSLWEVMKMKMADEIPIPLGASAQTQQLLRRMLAQHPENRFASYQELLDAIDRAFLTAPLERRAAGDWQAATVAQSARKPSVWHWAAIGVAVLTIMSIIGALVWRQSSARNTPPPQMTSGNSVNLFSGKSLSGWFPERGNWQPTTDDEGGTVLAGSGLIRRPIPNRSEYRLLMGVDLKSATGVEVHFGLNHDGFHYVFRITPTEAVLKEQTGDFSNPQTLARKLVQTDSAGLSTPYREVRIDRIAGKWYTYYNNQWIGAAPAHDNELPEFCVQCDAGPAYFETIEVIELLPAK